MRLAVFSESYEPIVNGVSVCVATLRDGLEQNGDHVTVFAPAYLGHIDTHPDVIRVPSLRTPFMPTYPIPVPISSRSRQDFRTGNFDIVHTQTPFLLGLMGLDLGRKNSVPVISTNHTLYTEYAHYFPVRPKSITKWIMTTLMRCYYNRCKVVVVPSQPVVDILRSYGVTTRLEIVKTGVDPVENQLDHAQRSELRKNLVGTDDGALLLYVGRIAREKNLTMMLRAIQQLDNQGINARMVIVGGGPALDETKRFAQSLNMRDDRVVFTGMMERQKIRKLYDASDLFVFPSTTETQGIAICEAMTAGLPVVAVNAGGIPENVTSGVDGYLTNDSHIEFAQKINELLEDPVKRLEMGAKAQISSSRFTVEEMIVRMQRIYESVLNR
jgi:glycosyltransferase involved in cell wall biosynthesis